MMYEALSSPSIAAAGPEGRVPLLRLRGVSKQYGTVQALAPLDLDIYPRDFVAMLGPSGCGKTTLLRMIGGFIPPSSGSIEIAGTDVTPLGPERRPTNMVFQGYGLFPHMNVEQNVGYGLRIQKRPREEIAERVADALRLVQLMELAKRTTEQLSGGQQQRVALARALVMRPKVLLLDEPLAALDLKLRHAMQDELRRIHHEIGGTFVFVTHDQGEALALANRIAVMHNGRLEQVGTAEDIYVLPQTRFVATFIGEANVFDGTRASGTVTLQAGPRLASTGPDGAVAAIVRPEDLGILEEGETRDHIVEAVIEDAIFLGSQLRYRLRGLNGESLLIHTRPGKGKTHSIDDKVRTGWCNGDHRLVSA